MIQVGNREIKYCEHMVHNSNLNSIFTHGLLSHNQAHQKGLIKEDISMSDVQRWRKRKSITVNNKKLGLHDFVNFYFNSKNPMLYSRRSIQKEMVIFLVDIEVIDWEYSIFTDGNAASKGTNFFQGRKMLNKVPFDLIFSGSWNNDDEEIKKVNKRKMCAEVLAYPSVNMASVKKIICPNQQMYNFVQSLASKPSHIDLQIQSGYFFL